MKIVTTYSLIGVLTEAELEIGRSLVEERSRFERVFGPSHAKAMIEEARMCQVQEEKTFDGVGFFS